MKKCLFVTVLLATAVAALATLVANFKSWDDLIDRSPEIILARCVATRDFISATNTLPVVSGAMIDSEIEVILILKGDSKPGFSRLASRYWPYRGQYFLVLPNYGKDQNNIGYTAIEPYRVIPLEHFFDTNQLAGKTLKEQVQLIRRRRLEELDRDNKDKLRLEVGLENAYQGTSASSNEPPKAPKVPPNQGKF
jgi:hypothetical protein